ncbi:hypothetical protein [Halalkalicoccus ordinarius]|uniref:hypothetical protein n=1 Tax=Halalkalicoccus ordinarius TaxID=3116651 RepID=UPI00300EB9C2
MSRRSTVHENTPESRSSNRTIDVLIVGGDVSGLTAGVNLSDEGSRETSNGA